MNRKLFMPLLAALPLAAAACGSSSPATHAKSGAETITGHASGASVVTAKAPTLPLIASGVFADTGHITLGGPSNGKGVLTFTKGNLNVTHTVNKKLTSNAFNKKPKAATVNGVHLAACTGYHAEYGTYTITSGTGAYKGATGHGTYTVTFNESASVKNGKCATAHNAPPKSASVVFTTKGTVTLPG